MTIKSKVKNYFAFKETEEKKENVTGLTKGQSFLFVWAFFMGLGTVTLNLIRCPYFLHFGVVFAVVIFYLIVAFELNL